MGMKTTEHEQDLERDRLWDQVYKDPHNNREAYERVQELYAQGGVEKIPYETFLSTLKQSA